MTGIARPRVRRGSSPEAAAPSCPPGSPRWRSGALPTYRVAEIVAEPFELPVFIDAWKAQCHTCRHLEMTTQPLGNEVLRCRRHPLPSWGRGAIERSGYCIDARDDGPCGPDASLWEAQ